MKEQDITHDQHEVLTVDELAARLKVCRSTVFSWMQDGILVSGRHYFKVGRVLRFVYCAQLVQELLQGSETAAMDCERTHSVSPEQGRIKRESPLNWDY